MEEKEYYFIDDDDDFEAVVRFVGIIGEGINCPYLGMGLTATEKFYNLAKDGKIKNAESIKIERKYNCEVVFKGNELIKILQEYYTEYIIKYSDKNNINPDLNYRVLAVDYS